MLHLHRQPLLVLLALLDLALLCLHVVEQQRVLVAQVPSTDCVVRWVLAFQVVRHQVTFFLIVVVQELARVNRETTWSTRRAVPRPSKECACASNRRFARSFLCFFFCSLTRCWCRSRGLLWHALARETTLFDLALALQDLLHDRRSGEQSLWKLHLRIMKQNLQASHHVVDENYNSY